VGRKSRKENDTGSKMSNSIKALLVFQIHIATAIEQEYGLKPSSPPRQDRGKQASFLNIEVISVVP